MHSLRQLLALEFRDGERAASLLLYLKELCLRWMQLPKLSSSPLRLNVGDLSPLGAAGHSYIFYGPIFGWRSPCPSTPVQSSMFPVLASDQGAPPPRSCFGCLLRTFWAKECCDVWQFGPWHTPCSGLGEVLGGQSINSEFLQPQAVLAEPPRSSGVTKLRHGFL